MSESGQHSYDISDSGIPLFAEKFCSPDALIQQQHYDDIADAYEANLNYPHTVEYMSYLDGALNDEVAKADLGVVAEVCCGKGEAFALYREAIGLGVGIDVSVSMLSKGQASLDDSRLYFVQGDATQMPLSENSFDTVLMLGGIHHVPDRQALFEQVYKILKPGGTFIWREPVSDFWLWKLLRSIVYRVSPVLDHDTERPLTWDETVPPLEACGFEVKSWRTYGFFGFCIFMNSDVLYFNRAFRFIPGIRPITRAFARLDDWCVKLPGLKRAGLQVIGAAVKPGEATRQ